jgi:hypothetical protein
MPSLQLLLDQEECYIDMIDDDFNRDATILMSDKNVQFKVKNLNIIVSNQVHILEWLLLKSPKLISLDISRSYAGFS